LNLIEKTSLTNRKPGFKWLGSVGFTSFMNLYKQKPDKIFLVTKDPISHNQTPSLPVAKHFAPKVIQNVQEVPKENLIAPKKRNLKERLSAKYAKIPQENKENINVLNHNVTPLTKKVIFKKLNLLLDIINGIEHKEECKFVPKMPMLNSQLNNIKS
jgi:hypothetical protein